MKKRLFQWMGAFIAICFFSTTSFATDGYFSAGYGTINKGLAGAGIAYYQGSLINGNPAGHVFLGQKYQFGVDFFNPNRQYTIDGNPSGMQGTFGLMPGTIESETKLFLVPSIGANWMLNDDSGLSVSLFGNGGMNTDYPTNTFHDPASESTGVNLGQMFGNFTYSRKLAENHSIGVTGVVAYQYFEAVGLTAFSGFSSDAANLTGNDKSNGFGLGFKLGYMGTFGERFSVGATYQSKVSMSEFDEYAGLFAEQGGFDIPASWTAGFSWNMTDDFTLMADVKQIFYGDVKSIANPMIGAMGFNAPLGGDAGAGFGWEDVTVFKVGLAYSGIESWVFRGGFSAGNNPVPESEVMFNILAPGVIENHIALGLSKEVGNNGSQFHLAFSYALNNSVKGLNPMDPPSGQTIEIEMNQIEVELGFSF